MIFLVSLLALAALAAVPFFVGAYPLGLGIGILGYATLATAWALFSGPTRYISLATVAFFGIGAYTVAVLADLMPYPLVLLCAALIGLVVAVLVGLATLRLAGIYFVIFTFGLAELVRQLVTYYEVNVHPHPRPLCLPAPWPRTHLLAAPRPSRDHPGARLLDQPRQDRPRPPRHWR